MRRFCILLCCLLLPLTARAHLEVAATTASMGMLARVVGGDAVRVTVLAPPDRDPHALQARPSMLRALRDAELVVAVGAELEVGWLPAAIAGAANPRILPGRPGYFEAAAQVPLLDAGQPADRARGDVHPMGNPHVNLDPARMAAIAQALAERLTRLRPGEAAAFRANAAAFGRAVEARLPGWRARLAGAPGAVLYHRDGDYLLARLGVPVLGYLEPVPGVPPGAGHLERLVGELRGRRGVVLRQAYQPAQAADRLAALLGWSSHVVPMEPSTDARAEDYFRVIDAWVTALASPLT
jgi:zinc/manganese transport system substrate-binding protein